MKKLLILTLTLTTVISLFSIAAPTASAAGHKSKHHQGFLEHGMFGWLHFGWNPTDPHNIKWNSF